MEKQYGISLDTAQKHLEEWLEAELMVKTNQSYTMGERSLTRANLAEIGREIKYWDGKVQQLLARQKGKRNRIYRAVPYDG